MLTLKVVQTGNHGDTITHVLHGDRISHTEEESNNHNLKFMSNEIVLGSQSGAESKQKFTMSIVRIFKGESYNDYIILPTATCYIMADGKTVDSFMIHFQEIE